MNRLAPLVVVPTLPVMASPGDLMRPIEERFSALERVTSNAGARYWERSCAAEGWSLALVCYHIARGFERQASFIEDAVGVGPHRYSWDETHALNAQIAGEHPVPPTPEEVMATARAAIERVRAVVTAMSDADLAAIAFVNGTFQGDVRWVVQTLMPQHADGHLASIASTIAT